MKKVMFILVVASVLVACGGNASTEAVSADSTTTVDTTTVDTTVVVADTTAVADSAQ